MSTCLTKFNLLFCLRLSRKVCIKAGSHSSGKRRNHNGFVLPPLNFQHAENLPTDGTDNFGQFRNSQLNVACGRLRSQADSSATIEATHDDWREIKYCNSQLNVACGTPTLFQMVSIKIYTLFLSFYLIR